MITGCRGRRGQTDRVDGAAASAGATRRGVGQQDPDGQATFAHRGSAGQFAQRTATTPGQQTVLRALDLHEPPRFFDFTLPDSR